MALGLISFQAQAVDFSLHGYYRTRFEFSHDLDLQRPNADIVPGDLDNQSNDRFGTIAFAQQRFRLNPAVTLNDNITFYSQIDLLDNLLFGQSDVRALEIYNPIVGTASLSPANGPFGVISPSAGDPLGSGGGSLVVKRLWVDLMTSAGQFRIGRQPSHFGLGIFNNDGNSLEGDYGDTFDRIMYLAGLPLSGSSRVNFGFVYDFAYEAVNDPSLSGLDGDVNSNWNDAMQTGMIALLQNDSFMMGMFGGLRFRNGKDGEPTTTASFVDDCTSDDGRPDDTTCPEGSDSTHPNFDLDNDGQTNDLVDLPAGKDGDTLVYTVDLYGKWQPSRHYSFAFEGVYLFGKIASGVAIDAIALDDPSQSAIDNPLTRPIELPLDGNQNDIAVLMGAVEADAFWDFGGEAHIQTGYASGDSNPVSSKITQLGFRPDYDIALILFDVPIGTSPALVISGQTELGRMPMSPNYVNNAIYWTTEYKHGFDISDAIPWAEDFKIGLKGITAYAPSNNLDLNLSEIVSASTGKEVTNLPHIVNQSKWYGFEIDASLEATFFEFLKWRAVAGVFVPGSLYDIKDDNASSNGTGIVDSILFDNAEMAFAGRTTLSFEF